MTLATNGQSESTRRIARQHLQTVRMLGVDFIPKSNSILVPQAVSSGDVRAGNDPIDECVIVNGASEQSTGDKSRRLNDLRTQHDRECPHCTAVTYHTQTVFGEGDPDASVMFIGEAPGEEEDRTGRPFVGRAGQKLNDIIKAMGFEREQVYIANILKSRPPDNRT